VSARAERRRHERAQRKRRHVPGALNPDAEYGVVAGWFQDMTDLDEAKQRAHDILLNLMGDQRTGPVQWVWFTGDEATDALRTLRQGAVGEHADHYRRIGGHLREYGGYLLVTMAEGHMP
jgi:hypothetical protein